jgi:hypothetical protein
LIDTKRIALISYKLLPLAFPLIGYLLVSRYYDAYIFPAPNIEIDFHLFQQARKMPILLSLCIFPISIILSVVWLLHSKDAWQRNVSTILVIVLIFLNGMSCLSTLGLVFSRFEHFYVLKVKDRVYYIDSIWKIGVGHNSIALFALFECDSQGVICKIVHNEYRYPTEEEYEAMQVALIPHPDGNKISMQIDDEIVYTHPV